MRRVSIVGNSGSGKSTLARELGAATGLPVFHLDKLFWEPGWRKPDEADFRRRLDEVVASPEWIIDGNYSRTMRPRLERSDTIVYFDLPRLLCMWSVVRRRLASRRGEIRQDLPADCPDKLDAAFFWWIWSYRRRSRQKTIALLEELGEQRRVVWLRKRTGTSKLVQQLTNVS